MVKKGTYPYTKATCELDIILQKVYAECKCVGWEWEGFLGEYLEVEYFAGTRFRDRMKFW